jgi:predicted transposase YdaD
MKMAKTKWQIEMDEHARISGALQEGEAKGEAKGEIKGVANTKMDNATRMIARGYDDKEITEITDLTAAEVGQLRLQLCSDK